MNNQTRNHLNLQKHIADQDHIIRVRNAEIAALRKRAEKAEQERDDKGAAYDQLKVLFGSAERAAIGWSARAQDADARVGVRRAVLAPIVPRDAAHHAVRLRISRGGGGWAGICIPPAEHRAARTGHCTHKQPRSPHAVDHCHLRKIPG